MTVINLQLQKYKYMKSISSFRPLLWILLLGLGFVAGTAWNNRQINKPLPQISQEETPVNTEQENTEERTSQELMNDYELATIRLFEKSAPSVAYINTSQLRQDFWTRNVMEIPQGSGSGFVWDIKGHIITNYHVIQDASRIQVTLADRSTWDAELIGAAPEKDIAVLKIKAPVKALKPIPVGSSDNLLVGQSVYAIGNPFGLDQTLTTGIISALGREIQSVSGIPIRDVVQTDAAINPGNSGGPLLNSTGQLIGVNTAIYSPSGASAGIGFSIPVDVVKWVVPDLINFGKIMRPTLGIEYATQQSMRYLGLEGVLITHVVNGSAAAKAGLQPTYRNRNGQIVLGDIIVAFNNESLKSGNDLILALEKYKPGDTVKLTILRNDKKQVLTVKLDESR